MASDAASAPHPGDKPVPASGPTRAAHRIPLWLLTLGVGLASGLIGWAGGEAAYSRIKVEDQIIYPPNYDKMGGYEKQGVTSTITVAAKETAERKKAAVGFGLLGLALGAGLGLVGGWAAGVPRRMTIGGVLGGLAGAAGGAGLSWAAVPLFFRLLQELPESGLVDLFLAHALISIGVGGAAGLALGLGLGDRPAMVRALFGGLLGGPLGAIVVEIIYSVAYPLMRTFEPLATEPTPRLEMYLCVAAFIGLLAGLAAGRRRSPRAASV